MLVIACGAGYLLRVVFGYRADLVLGLIPARVTHDFWVWQIVTYMFMHGGLLHLLFNTLMLWMFGRLIESAWGSVKFAKYFFITGIGAAVFNLIFTPGSAEPIIGASGAIYGLLAAFAVIYPEATVYIYFLFPVTARQMAFIFCLLAFIASVSGGNSGVANLAHLGGMLTGYIYLKWYPSLMSRLEQTQRRADTSRESDISGMENEVNRILDKISDKGISSLTEEEKAVMRKYSHRIKPR